MQTPLVPSEWISCVGYNKLYSKSTANRTSGLRTYASCPRCCDTADNHLTVAVAAVDSKPINELYYYYEVN